jgi:hypothetical protein
MTGKKMSLAALKMRYQDEKHGTIIATSVIIFLCVFLVLLFFALSIVLNPSSSSSEVSAQDQYKLPCLEPITAPDGTVENTIYPAQSANISLRVLNATGLSGFGNAVAASLKIRGFSVIGADTFAGHTNDTQIRFGENAIREAYTLADNFYSPVLIMDDRDDGLIDVVIGRTFTDLKDIDLVGTQNTSNALVSMPKCVAPADVKPVAMLDHDTTIVKPYTTIIDAPAGPPLSDDDAPEGSVAIEETPPETPGE